MSVPYGHGDAAVEGLLAAARTRRRTVVAGIIVSMLPALVLLGVGTETQLDLPVLIAGGVGGAVAAWLFGALSRRRLSRGLDTQNGRKNLLLVSEYSAAGMLCPDEYLLLQERLCRKSWTATKINLYVAAIAAPVTLAGASALAFNAPEELSSVAVLLLMLTGWAGVWQVRGALQVDAAGYAAVNAILDSEHEHTN